MVVVMRPGAAAEEVDAVVARVEAAGGSAFVSRGVQRTIVGLVGDVVQFTALNLRAMAGVVVCDSAAFSRLAVHTQPGVIHLGHGGQPRPRGCSLTDQPHDELHRIGRDLDSG